MAYRKQRSRPKYRPYSSGKRKTSPAVRTARRALRESREVKKMATYGLIGTAIVGYFMFKKKQ